MFIINDIHLGVTRKAGTTPQSQAALDQYCQEQFRNLLGQAHGHLIILGDLFDSFTVDPKWLVFAFNELADWLHLHQTSNLHLVAGNHDWSPKGDKISSFHLLAHFLQGQFRGQVQVHDEGFAWAGGCAVIPHMPNQDLFDMEIDKACEDPDAGGYLLLHANFDNNFAEQADHSLNVSAEQADRLIALGWTLVFAHEHQGRKEKNGEVIVIGNQFPTSVADCLGNAGKWSLEVDQNGTDEACTWSAEGSFVQIDWQDLDQVPDSAQFIRVAGTATAEQAAAVVQAVAALRAKHSAFVISNAVKVDGVADMEALAEMSFEDIKGYDVLAALLEELTEEEGHIVKGLLQ